MNISGSCLCGAVNYSCSADPVVQANCHCRDCQKTTGSGYSSVLFVPEAAVEVNGDVVYFSREGKDGNQVGRGFCPLCGSQLFGKPGSMPGFIGIRAGTLDDPSLFQPAADIFTSRAAPWDHMDPTLPKFAELPTHR